MKPTATRVTGLAALAVLILVAAVHGADSDAALTKQEMANLVSSGSSSRTATQVAEAPSPKAAESLSTIPNGDFEQGQAVWTEFSQQGKDIIMDVYPDGVVPTSGSWLAWLGGACRNTDPPSDCEEVSYIEQELTVPTSTTNLSFWYWTASNDVCGFDFGWVKVDGVIIEEYDLCTATDTGTWVLGELDISAYAGQTVTLRFQADTDASDNSNFFVDDVAFDVAGIFSDGFESGDTSAWSITVE